MLFLPKFTQEYEILFINRPPFYNSAASFRTNYGNTFKLRSFGFNVNVYNFLFPKCFLYLISFRMWTLSEYAKITR